MCDATIGPDVSSAASLAPWLTNWFATLSVRDNTAAYAESSKATAAAAAAASSPRGLLLPPPLPPTNVSDADADTDAKHKSEHELKPPHEAAAADAAAGDGSVRRTPKRKHWSSQVGTLYSRSRSRSPAPSLRVRKRRKRAVSWPTDTKLDLLFHSSRQPTDEVIALDDLNAAIAMWLTLHHHTANTNGTQLLRQILQQQLCNRMVQGRWDMVHFLPPLVIPAEANPQHRIHIKYVHLQVTGRQVRDVDCGVQVHVALSVQGALDSSSPATAVSHPTILATRDFVVAVGS